MRDRRRRLINALWATFGRLPIVLAALWALTTWRSHGVADDLRMLVSIVYWILVVAAIWLTGKLLFQYIEFVIKVSFGFIRLSLLWVRKWNARLHLTMTLQRIKIPHLVSMFFLNKKAKRTAAGLRRIRKKVIEEEGEIAWSKIADEIAENNGVTRAQFDAMIEP